MSLRGCCFELGVWMRRNRSIAVYAVVALCLGLMAVLWLTKSNFDPSKARTLTISGSGDILIHNTLWWQARDDGRAGGPGRSGGRGGPDFAPLLSGVRDLVDPADLAVCHIETQFSDTSAPETKFPHLYVHPLLAVGVKDTGFDDCSMASNWSFDKGFDGIKRTNAALEASKLHHSGTYVSQAASTTPQVYEVNGVKVAHLSYTDPVDSPEIPDKDWAIGSADPTAIAEDATAARDNGAEVVVVSLQSGNMGSNTLDDHQRELTEAVANTGSVNLVIGHGSHTVQPARKVNGTWIVFHGNLVAGMADDTPRMREGVVSVFTLHEIDTGTFETTTAVAYPILDVSNPERVIDLTHAKCSGPVPSRWRTAYQMTKETLGADGALAAGLVVAKPCSGPT